MPAPKNNKNAIGNDGGAPSKYKAEYAKQAYKLCLLGSTDKQLADFFEVDENTIVNWKKEHIEFLGALKGGKAAADAKVAAALFKRAIGFQYDEITFEKVDSKLTLEATAAGDIKTSDAYRKKVVTKLVIPDVGAQSLWLKNRQKDLWRDKHEVGFDFENMPEEMLDQIIEGLTAKAKR